MPQTIEHPTLGRIEFPDEMSDDQIVSALRSLEGQAQPAGAEPSIAQTGAGLASEVAIGEGAKLAGAAAGTAIAPGLGTAIGYVVGAIGGGISGSIARQKIMRPGEEISYGEVVADTLTNLLPGAKAAKSASVAARVAQTAARNAAIGAGIGASSEVIESAIDEKRLPTLDDVTDRALLGAALGAGLGATSEGFLTAYQKFAGLPSVSLDMALKAGDPNAKIVVDGIKTSARKYAEDANARIKNVITSIDEAAADQWARVRDLQDISAGGQIKTEGAPLAVKGDESDYYMKRRLAEIKIGQQNDRIKERMQAENDGLIERSRDLGVSAPELSKLVNDYLYSKHAIAFNKQHGEGMSGIGSNEASDIIKNFESRGLDKELDGIVSSRKSASKEILDTLIDGGLVSRELADKLRAAYPDYVPLNRVMDDEGLDDAMRIFGGGRYETTSTGVLRAIGSERDVRNISQNIYDNLAGAVRRAEVNKANLAFKNLIEQNPNNGVAVIRKPKVIGTTLIKDTSPEAMAARAARRDVPQVRIPIYEKPKNNAVTVFDKGERYLIELADPRVAAAMRGMNKQQANALMRAAMGWNRFLGGLYTRFNPDFGAPNLVRDRMEATVNAVAKMGPSQGLQILNPVSDMRTIVRNTMGMKSSSPEQAALDQLYIDFKNFGGSTGGMAMSTVRNIQDQIESLTKDIGKPKSQLVKKLNSVVDGINTVLEDSTRFGTFRRALAAGMTKEQAAFAARNSSFDPLLAGSQGDTIKALYLFANPAIQGSRNFLRSMSNPKVAGSVVAGLAGMSYALDKWNQMYDNDWRAKVNGTEGSEWRTTKNLILVTGKDAQGNLKYVSLPVGYSMIPFKVLADYTQRLASGEKVDVMEAGLKVGKQVLDSYNPVGGSLIPTPLRPMFELIANKDGLGRDIRPEWLEGKNISDVEKVFPWTAQTKGGELAMVLAENLQGMGYEVSPANLLYLYQTYTGGPGKTVQNLLNVTAKLWNGQKIERNEIPIARRFYGNTFAEAIEMRNGQKQLIDTLEKQENTDSARASRLAYGIVKRFNEATTPEEKAAALRVGLSDPEVDKAVAKRVYDRLRDQYRGITFSDQQIRGLGVDNGMRARFYYESLERMPPEERVPFLQEQIQKGNLTPDVQRQLMVRQEFRRLFPAPAGQPQQ